MSNSEKRTRRGGKAGKARPAERGALRKSTQRDSERTSPLALVASGETQLLRSRFQLRMSRDTFARLASLSSRSIANIESGKPVTPTTQRRVVELERLTDQLAKVLKPEAIGPWLETPNPAFDGLKPLEVVERGEIDRVWQMIYFLESGVPT